MGRVVLLILVSFVVLVAQPSAHQLTSPEETLVLLEEIKGEAIVIGSGPKEVHSFIDPYCSMSALYIQHLLKNQERMRDKYTVYLYLYELKRKNSVAMIENIYDAEDKLALIKQVMVEKQTMQVERIGDVDIDEKIAHIAKVAQKIGVFKRPYIITNGKGQ
jgi:hypothetical protein